MVKNNLNPVRGRRASKKIIKKQTSNGVKIYNTLSKRKEVVKPRHGKKINLFVCGPTVYDFSHIGHARTCIVFDCFVKYLQQLGFNVMYLQNITNIDDKIIVRAREKGVLPLDLASVFEKEYLKDMKALGISSVRKYARATDYIKEIISQIERLMKKGYAYTLDDGIYYDISKFKNYGKLSGRTALEAEDSVSRIDYTKDKKNRGDFCLWKFTQQDGEPSWNSPFGKGRPGWHIEDTAITEKFFGAQYDIHGGGIDLLFPHHEAEISQMEAISGKKPMARFWMHIGFLTIDGQKMSKSLNNFILIGDFLKRHHYRHLRFWIAKNLWRSPLDYSESAIIEAKSALEKIEEFLRKIKEVKNVTSKVNNATLKKVKEEFYKNLHDDFNTPKAFATIFEFIKDTNKDLDQDVTGPVRGQGASGRIKKKQTSNGVNKKYAGEIYKFFEEINNIFDIINFKQLKHSSVPKEVKKLMKVRESYRKKSDWQKADEIRQEIEKYGFSVDDTKEGTILKKV